MSGFDLYYWPVPFRGQFIRAILAYKGCDWEEHDSDASARMMGEALGKQPLPFMGPPLLIDRETKFAIAQMPAIAAYLGERLELLPDTPEGRALSFKIVNDANDVIDELTLDGGRDMWTAEKWKEFRPRLQKWMGIFEETGKRHDLTPESGHILGTAQPGIADLVTAILWNTMSERFSSIASLLRETAPAVHGLSERIMAIEELRTLKDKTFTEFGHSYCGGEIEKSLRKVAG